MCLFPAVAVETVQTPHRLRWCSAHGRGKACGRPGRGAKNPHASGSLLANHRGWCASMGRGRLHCAAPTAGEAGRFRPVEARRVAPQHQGTSAHDQTAAWQPWRVQHRTRAVGSPGAVPMPAPHPRGVASGAHPLTLPHRSSSLRGQARLTSRAVVSQAAGGHSPIGANLFCHGPTFTRSSIAVWCKQRRNHHAATRVSSRARV